MQTMKLDMQSFIKNLESNGVIVKSRKAGQKVECKKKYYPLFWDFFN